ncbi:MAG TPA: NAD-dependent epimerase/dehydratase family protein [Chloroflexota bacterium]|nr:NAD-dependent epimerase/dehydratase family protein [Chloroflexota bacterium]
MHVLITGGAGFIGSHLADALVAAGDRVTVVDNLSRGDRRNVPVAATFENADVADEEIITVIGRYQPDAVVHCAAQASVVGSMARPLDDVYANQWATWQVAHACAVLGVGQMVFLSSGGAIYGDVRRPAVEGDPPCPANFYGVHKWAAERYVELSGVPATILRLANVFGPRQRSDLEGGVVAIFLERLIAGQPIILYGGEQTRDFVYVSDVVDAIQATIQRRLFGIWNVGSGEEVSIRSLLELIEREVGRTAEIHVRERRPSDVSRSCVDATRLTVTGAWRRRVELAEGIRQTLRASY